MTDYQPQIYPEPQDKYGLLAHWRKQHIPILLQQLKKILTECKSQTILDYTCGISLYASELTEHGWQVTVPNQAQEREEFDAVICMESNLIQYQEQLEMVEILRSMFQHLSEDGVFVFCLPNLEGVPLYVEEMEISPLLLGEEHDGKRCSVVRSRRCNQEVNQVLVDYIYLMENLATGAVTVDREEVRQYFLLPQAFYDLIDSAGADSHYDFLLENDRMVVCGKQRYLGPKSLKDRFPKVYDDLITT